MARDAELSRDEMGSGIEPPVSPRVRRAFGLLERFAPAAGARWAVELWCTPPAVEMSLAASPRHQCGARFHRPRTEVRWLRGTGRRDSVALIGNWRNRDIRRG